MPEIDSTLIKFVDHDPKTDTLRVHFYQGRVYEYAGVPAGAHEQMIAADSPGRFFHQWIKPFYSGSEVTEE